VGGAQTIAWFAQMNLAARCVKKARGYCMDNALNEINPWI